MKTKLFTKARIIVATLAILSIGLVTGIAETVAPSSGCPEATGGYASTGIRTRKPCIETVKMSGYWWHIKGEVKWVGTVFASMGGEFQKDVRNIEITGQEYTCTGYDKVCWVCNCYHSQSAATIEF